MNSSKHRSLGSATRNVDESLHQKSTFLSVWEFEFGIPNRYTDFKIALDTSPITNIRKIVDAHYKIHDNILKLVDNSKYLGITLSKNVSWKNHIEIITAKTNNTRLVLQRNFVKTDRKTKLKCYYT